MGIKTKLNPMGGGAKKETTCTLTVVTSPSNADCYLTYNGVTYNTKTLVVDKGATVYCSVSHYGYYTQTGSWTITSSGTKSVSLTAWQYYYLNLVNTLNTNLKMNIRYPNGTYVEGTNVLLLAGYYYNINTYTPNAYYYNNTRTSFAMPFYNTTITPTMTSYAQGDVITSFSPSYSFTQTWTPKENIYYDIIYNVPSFTVTGNVNVNYYCYINASGNSTPYRSNVQYKWANNSFSYGGSYRVNSVAGLVDSTQYCRVSKNSSSIPSSTTITTHWLRNQGIKTTSKNITVGSYGFQIMYRTSVREFIYATSYNVYTQNIAINTNKTTNATIVANITQPKLLQSSSLPTPSSYSGSSLQIKILFNRR